MWLIRLTPRLTERKFSLRVLAQLNSFVHCSNDICFGQELVRNELSWSHSDSTVLLPPTTVETEAC